jgi:hypothetical protein
MIITPTVATGICPREQVKFVHKQLHKQFLMEPVYSQDTNFVLNWQTATVQLKKTIEE